MTLHPTGGRVFVVPDHRKFTVPTQDGAPALHLPPSVIQWATSGRVLAASNTYRDGKGRERPTGIAAGDRVLFDYRDVSTVSEIELEGQRVLVFTVHHIKAILTESVTEADWNYSVDDETLRGITNELQEAADKVRAQQSTKP